jgi:hypothetical protein
VQVLELLDLVGVGALAVLPRNLEEGRQTLQAGMREKDTELVAEETLADVRMAVAVRAEGRGRVVDVQRPQAIEADPRIDVLQKGVESSPVGHVDARDPEVARVEAEAEPRVASETLHEDGELVHGTSHRPAGAG